jgi:F-type H+-transporting ATPase subunit epsilon
MAVTHVELVTPTRTLFSGEAEFVLCRSEGGEIAFLADHMPYLGVLEPGLVRIDQENGESQRLAVHGGFVEVRDNRVTLLADVAEPASEIDTARAQRAMDQADQRLSQAGEGGDLEAAAARRRAEVRLEVAAG